MKCDNCNDVKTVEVGEAYTADGQYIKPRTMPCPVCSNDPAPPVKVLPFIVLLWNIFAMIVRSTVGWFMVKLTFGTIVFIILAVLVLLMTPARTVLYILFF